MSKKIFICGSCPFEGVKSDIFNRAALGIAATLFNKGYDVIITTTEIVIEDSDEQSFELKTIDYLVLSYFNEKLAKESTKREILYYESDKYNPFKNTNFDFIKFNRKRIGGNSQFVLMNAIQDSDCVLLLGGKVTVQLVGQLATLLGKPMIPLPWPEGSSSEGLWKEFSPRYDPKITSIIDNMLILIQGNQDDTSPFESALEKTIKDTIKLNPFITKTKASFRAALYLFISVIILLVCWGLLYAYGYGSGEMELIQRVGFAFACIPLSVTLGTILRIGSFQNLRIVLLDLSKALIVSFSLALLYFYAGYLATGTVPTIGMTDFERVTINLSILGLLSGFLLEKAQALLREKLESFVKNDSTFKSENETET